jgi:hypothetical protein
MTRVDPDRLQFVIEEVVKLSRGDPRKLAAACDFKYGAYEFSRLGIRASSTAGPQWAVNSWLRQAERRLAEARK